MALSTFLNKNNLFAATTLRNSTRKEESSMGLLAAQDQAAIIESRASVAEYLQIALEQFVFPDQAHSSNVHLVSEEDDGKAAVAGQDAVREADARYTYDSNIVLNCSTADCVPVLLYNEVTGLIATIHSGWQGTVKEITPKLLKQLIHQENNAPEDIKVILGPALSQ